MNTRALLDVLDLGKRYSPRGGQGSGWILRNLTFSVAEGEFVTILGRSGAGKSTLLNVLAQMDTATVGQVWFDSEPMPIGQDAVLNPGLSCRVGYVSQDDTLLPWRTTIENVLLPLQVQRKLTPTTREYAQMLMQTSGLAGFEHYYPRELSGGMRKRAALIRTLAYDPPIILMDEPFGALDAETRALLQDDLLKLWALRRKTILFVTHDISEAIALGDRTVVLTQRPARVRKEYRIGIPRPRDLRDMLMDRSFQDLYRVIRTEV
jgi:NitT/TauT family transport system ATP-binding protein